MSCRPVTSRSPRAAPTPPPPHTHRRRPPRRSSRHPAATPGREPGPTTARRPTSRRMTGQVRGQQFTSQAGSSRPTASQPSSVAATSVTAIVSVPATGAGKRVRGGRPGEAIRRVPARRTSAVMPMATTPAGAAARSLGREPGVAVLTVPGQAVRINRRRHRCRPVPIPPRRIGALSTPRPGTARPALPPGPAPAASRTPVPGVPLGAAAEADARWDRGWLQHEGPGRTGVATPCDKCHAEGQDNRRGPSAEVDSNRNPGFHPVSPRSDAWPGRTLPRARRRERWVASRSRRPELPRSRSCRDRACPWREA